MNDYDFWSGLTELNPLNYFLGLAVFAIIGGVIAAVEKHRRS
jgi:hypothetical protein